MHAITLGSAQISTTAGEAVGLDFSSVSLDRPGWIKVLAASLITALETIAQENPDAAAAMEDAKKHVVDASAAAVLACTPPAPEAESDSELQTPKS